MNQAIPAIPSFWSALTWQQLCTAWEVKLRYGGNPDVARVAAMLAVGGMTVDGKEANDNVTGETVFLLKDGNGRQWTTTARQLAHTARQTMKWFDYPYGDRGDDAVKDEKGKVIKEAREPVHGYVNPNWRDAMQLPEETLTLEVQSNIEPSNIEPETLVFSLPSLACNNLTWEQYRSLQPLVPQLWAEGTSDEQRRLLQAQFVAHCLVPEQQKAPTADCFRPPHEFKYDSARAEQSVPFWQQQLDRQPWLYHICFQVYQTAVQYYETVFPLLFSGGGKDDPLRDALTGEVGTINGVMKYANYTSQQEVWETPMPYVLDILNTMTKEAKEIEKMNSRIKKK